MSDTPLVTVVVITYNAAGFVTRTLESIKKQTYPNLELIISDDCSPDDTVRVCEEWVADNKNRFIRCIVTTTPRNGGICWNYNHALKNVRGEYVKYIAGDDELMPNCIEEFVKSAKSNPQIKIFISGTIPFVKDKGNMPPRFPDESIFNGGASYQEDQLLEKGTVIEGPTLFLETNALKQLGGFNEKYPFIEDYPLYMKYLANGYKIHLVKQPLIHYQIHESSVSRSDSRFSDSILRAIDDLNYDANLRKRRYLKAWHFNCNKMIRRLKTSDSHIKRRVIPYCLRIIDIYNYKRFIKHLFNATKRI